MARTESPSINGFTIENLKMTESIYGNTISCTLKRDGKKAGTFTENRDGEYTFKPAEGFSQDEIERYLQTLPLIECCIDLPKIHWTMGILVGRLIQKMDLRRELEKAKKKNCNIVQLTDLSTAGGYIMQYSAETPDEVLTEKMNAKYPAPRFTWKRFNSLESLNEVIA